MDYSKLSDAEIARRVWSRWQNNSICGISDGRFIYVKGSIWTRFDPCNNESDAWPIITQARISLLADYEKWDETTAPCGNDRSGNYTIEITDKNPLRAAMICYLKMQESE